VVEEKVEAILRLMIIPKTQSLMSSFEELILEPDPPIIVVVVCAVSGVNNSGTLQHTYELEYYHKTLHFEQLYLG
jgi:hypothetical protein